MATKGDVLSSRREVIDPEIGVNLVDLGLIRDVQISDDSIHVQMVLTVPGCPLAGYLMTRVREKVQTFAEGREVTVERLGQPWDPSLESER